VSETLQIALAGLVTAVQTAVVMYAAYHWPQGRQHDDEDDEDGKHARHKHKNP